MRTDGQKKSREYAFKMIGNWEWFYFIFLLYSFNRIWVFILAKQFESYTSSQLIDLRLYVRTSCSGGSNFLGR